MTRGNQRLPGSRGPFLGPDGKHIEDYQDNERAARAEVETGFLFDVGEQAIYGGQGVGLAVSIDYARFVPLKIQTHRWRLTKARAHLLTAATASLQAAIYNSDNVGNLKMVPGTWVKMSFPGAGVVEVGLNQEALLFPNTQYWVGVWNTSAIARTWLAAWFANQNSELVGVKEMPANSLPSSVNIMDVPHSLGAATDKRGIIAVQYLTAQAERLL